MGERPNEPTVQKADSHLSMWIPFFVSRVALVVAWLVPGLAHLIMGHRKQGIIFMVCIMGLFIGGEFMSGFKGVSPEYYRLTFIGQVFCGGPILFHLLVFGQPQEEEFCGSVSPWFDAGMLYMLIAGLLNIVGIADAVERGLKMKRPSSLKKEVGSGGNGRGVCENGTPD